MRRHDKIITITLQYRYFNSHAQTPTFQGQEPASFSLLGLRPQKLLHLALAQAGSLVIPLESLHQKHQPVPQHPRDQLKNHQILPPRTQQIPPPAINPRPQEAPALRKSIADAGEGYADALMC